jgi:hypothetical protein
MLVRMPTKSAKRSMQLRTPGAAQAIGKVKSDLRYRTPEKCRLLRYVVLERGAAAALLRAVERNYAATVFRTLPQAAF